MLLWRWLGRAAYWLAWPALFVYLRIGARTRVLVVAEDQILLVQSWMGDAKWALPGGGLHRGERPQDGAVREVAEETGVLLDAKQIQLLNSGWYSSQGLASYCHFFAARVDRPMQPRHQRGEILAARWFSLADIAHIPTKPNVGHALKLLALHRSSVVNKQSIDNQ